MDWKTRITEKIQRRIPELINNNLLLEDLLEEAFYAIVDYANVNTYDKKWDTLLVTCVATLYNYMGMEGTTERRTNGTLDFYDTSSILSPILAARISPCIKPSGYAFSADRFNYPN